MATADMRANEPKRPDGAGRTPWRGFALGAAGMLMLVAAFALLPVRQWAELSRDWFERQDAFDWLAFILVYALASAALVPCAMLTLAAGLIWGLWGFPIVLACATLGAALAFPVARHVARDAARRMIQRRPALHAVDAAIAEGAWKVVGLLRPSPALPFSLQNWVLGATSVRFVPSIAATFFGIMPGTLLYVWLGSAGGMVASGGGTLASYAVLGVGVLATLTVTIMVGRRASAELADRG